MHRTDAPGNVAGFYVSRDPLVPTAGTIFRSKEANAIQEEICQVIEAAGITLRSTADDETAGWGGQLLEAIRSLSGITPGCRLELSNTWQNGTDGDQTGNVLYLVPYLTASMPVPLNATGAFRGITVPDAGISIDRTGLTADTNYDVFLYDAAAPKLHLAAWASAGARSFTLARSGAFLVNNGALSGGPGAKLGLYLGTVRTVTQSGVQFNDSTNRRYVFNYFNRVSKRFRCTSGATDATFFPVAADGVVGILQHTNAGGSGLSVAFVSGRSTESGQPHGDAVEITMSVNAAAYTDADDTVRAGVVVEGATSTFLYGSATIHGDGASKWVATPVAFSAVGVGYQLWHFGAQCSDSSETHFNFGTRALDGTIRC